MLPLCSFQPNLILVLVLSRKLILDLGWRLQRWSNLQLHQPLSRCCASPNRRQTSLRTGPSPPRRVSQETASGKKNRLKRARPPQPYRARRPLSPFAGLMLGRATQLLPRGVESRKVKSSVCYGLLDRRPREGVERGFERWAGTLGAGCFFVAIHARPQFKSGVTSLHAVLVRRKLRNTVGVGLLGFVCSQDFAETHPRTITC